MHAKKDSLHIKLYKTQHLATLRKQWLHTAISIKSWLKAITAALLRYVTHPKRQKLLFQHSVVQVHFLGHQDPLLCYVG